jgi:hypothetical protein
MRAFGIAEWALNSTSILAHRLSVGVGALLHSSKEMLVLSSCNAPR